MHGSPDQELRRCRAQPRPRLNHLLLANTCHQIVGVAPKAEALALFCLCFGVPVSIKTSQSIRTKPASQMLIPVCKPGQGVPRLGHPVSFSTIRLRIKRCVVDDRRHRLLVRHRDQRPYRHRMYPHT